MDFLENLWYVTGASTLATTVSYLNGSGIDNKQKRI